MPTCATSLHGMLQRCSDYAGLHVMAIYVTVAAYSLDLARCYIDVVGKSKCEPASIVKMMIYVE